jgi:hypothetical protein
MLLSCFMDRIPLDDFPYADHEIKPRPIESPSAPVIVPPEPLPTSIKGTVEHDGPSRDEILLQAIVLVARKEQTPATRGALRKLIAKFSCEHGLGF